MIENAATGVIGYELFQFAAFVAIAVNMKFDAELGKIYIAAHLVHSLGNA